MGNALVFNEQALYFEVDFKEVYTIISGGLPYTGDYVVTPAVNEQMLNTANKIMEENLVIKSIPFFNTSNTAGGTTVYIGKELE